MSKDLNKKLLFGASLLLATIGGSALIKKKLAFSPTVTTVDDGTILFYQREYSPFCLKVRKIMDYKGIPYKAVNVLPFVHKKFLQELSGQGLIPVIKHKEKIIYDSTTIAHYLEEIKPEPSIFIKEDEALNQEVLLLEDWADEAFEPPFGQLAVLYMYEHPEVIAESNDYDTGVAIIDKNKEKIAPLSLKIMMKKYGVDVSKKAELKKKARANLDILSSKLENKEFLVGNRLTLADIAVASHLNVVQKVPYLAEDDAYSHIFEWQEKIFKATTRRIAANIT